MLSPNLPPATSINREKLARLQSRVTDSVMEDIFSMAIVSASGKHPARTEVHASSLIADDWCSREYVLGEFHPQEAIQNSNEKFYHLHAIFEHGWMIHKKWQAWYKANGLAVYNQQLQDYELDLTHYDPERMIYYSPDAIIRTIMKRNRVIEIKGINTDEYQSVASLPLEDAVKVSQTIKKARQQVNLYMWLEGLQYGAVLAEDKNTQSYRVWSCNFDFEVIRPFADRLDSHKLDHNLYRDTGHKFLPTRYKACKSVDSPRAKKCPMRELCFRKEEARLCPES